MIKIKMKKRTSLTLLLAGLIGIGASSAIRSEIGTRYETARDSIPTDFFEAKKELDIMREKAFTPYHVLERVFENEQSEKRFRDLHQRLKEYYDNPQIQSAVDEMSMREVYICLDGALMAVSVFSSCFGAIKFSGKYISDMEEKIK